MDWQSLCCISNTKLYWNSVQVETQCWVWFRGQQSIIHPSRQIHRQRQLQSDEKEINYELEKNNKETWDVMWCVSKDFKKSTTAIGHETNQEIFPHSPLLLCWCPLDSYRTFHHLVFYNQRRCFSCCVLT